MAPEQSFAFGDDAALVGTLTLPTPSGTQQPLGGLILFNAGVLPRTGAHRTNVSLARQAAARGISALRFDLHGHGDSGRANGRLGYLEQVDADLRSAMDELGRRSGAERFAILGFCSGALPALRAALADSRVDALLLYDGFAYPTLRSTLRRYLLRIRHRGLFGAVGGWARRITSGAVRVVISRLRPGKAGLLANSAGAGPAISREQLVRDLNTLAERGTRVVVLAAGDSFERTNYAGQFRDATRRHGLSRNVITAFLPDIDHVLTSLQSQKLFSEFVLEEWLQLRCLEATAARPVPAASSLEATDAGT